MNDTPDPSARLTDLEMLFTHLERTVRDLHEVILEQQKRIDGLESELARVKGQMTTLAQSVPEERDPQAERPPHW